MFRGNQRTSHVFLLALALTTVTLAGCTTPESTAGEIETYTYTATEYGFSGPDEIEAGLVEIELVNSGTEPHHVQLVRITGDHTYEDLMAELAAGAHTFPSWAEEWGGPNAGGFGPDASTSVVLDLPEGEYAMICVIPDAEGTPHVAHGMAKKIEVTGSDASSPDEPTPDVTVDLVDFSFEIDGDLEAGETTFRTINAGGEPHELTLVKLTGNTTPQEFLDYFKPGANNTGPPPGMFLGGITGITVGQEQFFTVNLEEGRYVLICFLPAHEDGHPHFTKGMLHEFTVA